MSYHIICHIMSYHMSYHVMCTLIHVLMCRGNSEEISQATSAQEEEELSLRDRDEEELWFRDGKEETCTSEKVRPIL